MTLNWIVNLMHKTTNIEAQQTNCKSQLNVDQTMLF